LKGVRRGESTIRRTSIKNQKRKNEGVRRRGATINEIVKRFRKSKTKNMGGEEGN